MTAPGDSVLIFILLALFVACCGYAAGRIHQRYQLKQDREEAYRDGYETASNRVFSLAVRSAVPKRSPDTDPGRAVRHQGAVSPSENPASAGPASPDPSSPDRRAHRRRSSKPAANAGRLGYPEPPPPSLGFPAPPPPPANAVAEPPAVGGVRYQQFPDPRTADGPELRRPAYLGPSALPGSAAAASGPSQPSAGPSPAASGPFPAAPGPLSPPGPASPGPGLEPWSGPGSPTEADSAYGPGSASSLGSVAGPGPAPVPTSASSPRSAPSPGSASSPSSVAGLGPAPVPSSVAGPGSAPVPGSASGPSSASGLGSVADPMPASASGSAEAEQPDDDRPAPRSGGKHTVPDELVHAATYRLPPDRVFRAKVPNGSNLTEEPTTNLPVPKPRRP